LFIFTKKQKKEKIKK